MRHLQGLLAQTCSASCESLVGAAGSSGVMFQVCD
jgi:hypothetical protein